MWLVVSSRLVRLMHTLGLITCIQAAMSATGVEFTGFLFVNDTNLIALASTKTESAHQVVAKLLPISRRRSAPGTAASGPQVERSNQKNAHGALQITSGRTDSGFSLAWKTCHATCRRPTFKAI
jgi:hypothetical protein